MRVEKGQPPSPPQLRSACPSPPSPADKLKMTVQPAKGGLGPVTLAWRPVEGAEGYEVELRPVRGEKRVLTASVPQVRAAACPPGPTAGACAP